MEGKELPADDVVPGDEKCCEKCRRLATMPASLWNIMTAKDVFERNVVPHHASSSALRESAMQGCHLCNLFWAAFAGGTKNRDFPSTQALKFDFYYDGAIHQMPDLNQDQCRIDITIEDGKRSIWNPSKNRRIGGSLTLERHGKHPILGNIEKQDLLPQTCD